jgi:hypothetical protein
MNELYIKLKSNTSIARSLKALISSEDGSSMRKNGATYGTLDPPNPPQADIVPHTPERIVLVESSTAGIHWQDDLIPILKTFVTTVDNTTMHAYAFRNTSSCRSWSQIRILTLHLGFTLISLPKYGSP